MSIKQQLDTFRQSRPYLETIAYSDLVSRTVLFASSDANFAQENLDALTRSARACFLDSRESGRSAMVMVRSTEAVLIKRSPRNPNEAICLICDPSVDVGEMRATADSILEALPGTEEAGPA